MIHELAIDRAILAFRFHSNSKTDYPDSKLTIAAKPINTYIDLFNYEEEELYPIIQKLYV